MLLKIVLKVIVMLLAKGAAGDSPPPTEEARQRAKRDRRLRVIVYSALLALLLYGLLGVGLGRRLYEAGGDVGARAVFVTAWIAYGVVWLLRAGEWTPELGAYLPRWMQVGEIDLGLITICVVSAGLMLLG